MDGRVSKRKGDNLKNENMAVKAYEKARKLKAEIVKEYLTELHYDETIVEKIR